MGLSINNLVLPLFQHSTKLSLDEISRSGVTLTTWIQNNPHDLDTKQGNLHIYKIIKIDL